MKLALIVSAILTFNTAYASGRFQLVRGENRDEDRLIDSQTGRLWKRSCVAGFSGNCTAHSWYPEPVLGISSDKEVRDYIQRETEIADSAKKLEKN